MTGDNELYRFQWAVCLDGYEDVRDPYSEDHRSRGYYEPVSTNWGYYDPEIHAPDLFLRLSKLQHSKDVAYDFIRTYGALGMRENESSMGTRIGYEIGQSVEELFRMSHFFKSVLDDLEENKVVEAGEKFNFIYKPRLTAGIDTSNPSRARYFLKPDSLYDFMAMQLAREITGGLEWRKCRNPKCDKSFPISDGRGTLSELKVGTKRKETCGSPACRKALTRLRAKERLKRKTKGF